MERPLEDMIDETSQLVKAMQKLLEDKDSIVVVNACLNLTVQVMHNLEMDPRVCIMAFSKTLAMYMTDKTSEVVSQLDKAELN